jgi:hypothetical protein
MDFVIITRKKKKIESDYVLMILQVKPEHVYG